MTREIMTVSELEVLQGRESEPAKEAQSNKPVNMALQLFQRQQENNLLVKKAMARELAQMEFSEKAIQQILHLEEEISF